MILWVSHGDPDIETAANWSGKISKVWGSRMERYADAVVGLPRSIRDHLTNQPKFGPDGGLYFPQGAQSAMGAPDNAWGRRPEELLSAAILRLDIPRAEAHMNSIGAAVNVRTDSVGGYNPFLRSSPLRIWATGVRNAYDMLFHSNGRLYSATNGSAANGATPATPNPNPFAGNRIDGSAYTGPNIPAISKVNATQPDLLFDIQPGGYYGHPNPTRSEFVLNGGNPTSGGDPPPGSQYPVGTQPDRNFRGAAYNFGLNYSPNGMAEYTYAGSFGGALAGKILVTRYSGGDDILVLDPRANGTIAGSQSGIAGFTGFVDPLDLAVDPLRGNIYVAEFGANRITLLRPVVPGAKAEVDNTTLRFVEPRGGNPSRAKSVTIRNTGTSALALPAGGLTIAGADASLFNLVGAPSLPTTIPAGESLTLNINFNPGSTVGLTIRTAQLQIKTNDPNNPILTVNLRGLPTTGTGGMNEPSLQRVFDLYELPIRTGDSDPNNTLLTIPNGAVTDELDIQRFVKAGGGPVTIAPIAAFAVSQNPAVRVGYYSPGTPTESDELFTINGIEAQSIDPFAQGSVKFDPGTSPFGIYGTFPGFTNSDGTNRRVFTENTLNTWESVVANRNKVRVYPLIDSNGNPVANSYVMAFEEFTSAYDYQDVVLVIRNVRPADAGPEIGLSNADMFPFADRLVMSCGSGVTA
ncbi:MAG TPA: choice-of-anchor D domain-containing protein, partial [Tepidisphaeraceae bacterium]|nr:choice-of-anchor D domain-containing protein [Tepidisphaeraceae bacterium]